MHTTNWVVASTQSSSGSNDRLFFTFPMANQGVERRQQLTFDLLSSCKRGVFVRPNVEITGMRRRSRSMSG